MKKAETKNKTANVRAAVFEFLSTFCAPSVPENNILWGNQNNLALPESEDFLIFFITDSRRQGSGVEDWSRVGAEESLTLLESVEATVQVDCYASSDNGTDGIEAMQRALSLEQVARSSVGVEFFRERGVGLLYADDPRDMTGVGDSEQYDRRWTVTLHISFCSTLEVTQDFFNAATVGVKNVDVAFKP